MAITEKRGSSGDIYEDAVLQILRLTQDRKLDWEQQDPSLVGLPKTPDERVEAVYASKQKYNGKTLRLYRKAYQIDVQRSILPTGISMLDKERRWRRKVVLELVDDQGITVWTFPDMSALNDLLTSVQYQVADVQGVLETILAQT
jgi:hypothetical protein